MLYSQIDSILALLLSITKLKALFETQMTTKAHLVRAGVAKPTEVKQGMFDLAGLPKWDS